MRRVAVIAALLLTGCGGGDGPRHAATPTPAATAAGPGPVVLATKNFTEQYVLGQLYSQALQARGFEVELKQDVGSSEIVDQALQIGVVDMYLEYMGVIAGELAGGSNADRPRTPGETYRRAKAFEERRGFTILDRMPVIEREVLRRQGPEFRRTVDAVSAKLTNRALRRMNAAVDLDGREPAEVAREFLAENGLL